MGERELWYDTEEKDSEHDRLSSRELHHVVILETDNLTNEKVPDVDESYALAHVCLFVCR